MVRLLIQFYSMLEMNQTLRAFGQIGPLEGETIPMVTPRIMVQMEAEMTEIKPTILVEMATIKPAVMVPGMAPGMALKPVETKQEILLTQLNHFLLY